MEKLVFYTIGIDYSEEEPFTYRGVFLRKNYSEVARFATGDVVADWASAMKFHDENPGLLARLSSCDHFVMDCSGWEWNEENFIVKNSRVVT